MVLAVATAALLADGATRTLSDNYCPGQSTTVAIAIDAPAGVLAVGLEDAPPGGWVTVTGISDGGSYDSLNHKVKWGPFFAGSIPTGVSYQVLTPSTAMGVECFAGSISFDGLNEPVAGDACMASYPDMPADLDGDCDVDHEDYAAFEACLAGPGNPFPPEGCSSGAFTDADLDADGDVDFHDFRLFQSMFGS
jgi:hypothetical protein